MTRVLIIRKPTNLEQHQDLLRQQLVPTQTDPAYLAFIKHAHEEHYGCFELLKASLARHGLQWIEAARGEDWPPGPFAYIVSLGGDGTLIMASYGIQDQTPLVGIRSSSASVGYLCAGDVDTVESIVSMMAKNELVFVQRQRLRARIERREGGTEVSPYAALNDFLYAACSPAATTRYRISSRDHIETHRSSGVWIATATGSTAAIGAAGGAPMAAHDPHLQFLVREPYRRHEDGLRLTHGFAEPQTDKFWIENQCPSAILALDGEKWTSKLRFGDVIRFELAPSVRVAVKPIR